MRKSARLGEFRRRKENARSQDKNGHFVGLFIKLAVAFFLVFIAFVFVKINTRYWNGQDKVGFAFKLTNGDVGVTIEDPKLAEITTLIIPGDTEVDVAENYGTLRIKNVWQLSQNEKLGGRLLPETLTQNFLFPVSLWSDEKGEELGKGDVTGIIKFVFGGTLTNIPLGDRLNLGIFALKIGSLGKSEINLGDSQFLHKEVLSDGLPGYKLNGTPSERLTIFFSDNDMADAGTRVYIVDSTGSPGVADKVGTILEVLGGKVVSIDKKNTEASDCAILGKNKNIVRKVSTLFSCKIISGQTDFDLEIRLGGNFAKRF